MNLSSHVPTSSSSAKSPIPPKGPGIVIATGKPESRMRRNSKSDATSSSQARLKDAYLGGLVDTATGKPAATKEESGDVDLSESETGSEEDVTGKPVACKTAAGKPYAPSKSDCQGGPQRQNGHTIYKCLQPQFIIRKQYSRSSGGSTDENTMTLWIWLFGHISECHSSSSRSSWQDYEVTIREE